MATEWNFKPIPIGWVDRFPDGDYTVGRGADPRGKAEREADPTGCKPTNNTPEIAGATRLDDDVVVINETFTRLVG